MHDSEQKQEATQAELLETRQQLQDTQSELQGLQQVQVVEIEARCREIDDMKARLEGELGGLQRERDSLAASLQRAQEQLKEMRWVLGRALCAGPALVAMHLPSATRESQHHSEGEVEKLRANTAGLEGEVVRLRAALGSLQVQLADGVQVQDSLQKATAELDHTLSELESTRTTAMLQQQQVRLLRLERLQTTDTS